MADPGFNIAAVERDTGLSKDVLRMWERRYGFPVPARDDHGERIYSAEQVDRLRLIKRLMNQGHRPGKLIGMPAEALLALASRRAPREADDPDAVDPAAMEQLLDLIKSHDANAYAEAMQQQLLRRGLKGFVQDVVAPLTTRVGEAWEDGRFEVFEEHLFTEMTKRVLRQVIAALPPGRGRPRVLLTSMPDEQHTLGLLMTEALLTLDGAECIPLGPQMPLIEISRAVAAHQADIVALSFSSAFSLRKIPEALGQLRQLLPPETALWAGGSGVAAAGGLVGVELFASLEQGMAALAEWRRLHPQHAG